MGGNLDKLRKAESVIFLVFQMAHGLVFSFQISAAEQASGRQPVPIKSNKESAHNKDLVFSPPWSMKGKD